MEGTGYRTTRPPSNGIIGSNSHFPTWLILRITLGALEICELPDLTPRGSGLVCGGGTWDFDFERA